MSVGDPPSGYPLWPYHAPQLQTVNVGPSATNVNTFEPSMWTTFTPVATSATWPFDAPRAAELLALARRRMDDIRAQLATVSGLEAEFALLERIVRAADDGVPST